MSSGDIFYEETDCRAAVRRMGEAAFYRVLRDVLPDKLTFEDRCKGSIGGCCGFLSSERDFPPERSVSVEAVKLQFAL